jgi:hypothetical protein
LNSIAFSLFLDPPLSQEKENFLPTSQTAPDETQKRTGLNPIEPKEVENKRRIAEPDCTKSAGEVESRVCAAFSCSCEDYLFISDNVS